MVRDTSRTRALVEHLFSNGVLATGLAFPVVPRGDEEIRFQVNADHTEADVDATIESLGYMFRLAECLAGEPQPIVRLEGAFLRTEAFLVLQAIAGQLGLGYLARVTSKALSYVVGGAFYFIAVPLYCLRYGDGDTEAGELSFEQFHGAIWVDNATSGRPSTRISSRLKPADLRLDRTFSDEPP